MQKIGAIKQTEGLVQNKEYFRPDIKYWIGTAENPKRNYTKYMVNNPVRLSIKLQRIKAHKKRCWTSIFNTH